MKKNSEFVSRVNNELKLLNKDDSLSRRFILNVGKSKARTYMSQKLLDRTLFREANIITTIPCFEMELQDIKSCPFLEFRRCKVLMKSKKPLPELLYSRYGSSILRIFSLDNNNEFYPSNGSADESGREFGNIINKYYVRDNHLYITNAEVYAVELELITMDLKAANDASACSECDECTSIWDYEFVCPDKLYEPIVQETINELTTITRRIPEDENPNLDSNIKSGNV